MFLSNVWVRNKGMISLLKDSYWYIICYYWIYVNLWKELPFNQQQLPLTRKPSTPTRFWAPIHKLQTSLSLFFQKKKKNAFFILQNQTLCSFYAIFGSQVWQDQKTVFCAGSFFAIRQKNTKIEGKEEASYDRLL